MKVSHDSPDLLILDHVPWIMAGIFSALILGSAAMAMIMLADGELIGVLVGLGGVPFFALFLVAFVRRVQVVLDRRAGTATVKRRGLVRSSGEQIDLHRLRKAVVQTSRSSDSDTHRPALLIAGRDEALPILFVYSSGRSAGRDVRRINDWLEAGRALDNGTVAP